MMNERGFTDLCDHRLLLRGNAILQALFRSGAQSIRQTCSSDSEAKASYRFLGNDRISEEDIVRNMQANCKLASKDKYVLCIQDTTEINLSSHAGRLKYDGNIGKTNGKHQKDIGYFMHPCLVIDAFTAVPYGYADVKIWNREMTFEDKYERSYQKLPIEQKESYRWISSSKTCKEVLEDTVKGMVVIQDREGDIYDQFDQLCAENIGLLVRSRINRRLRDGTKLYDSLNHQEVQHEYSVAIEAKGGRKARKARIGIKYRMVELLKSGSSAKQADDYVQMWYVEAEELDNETDEKIIWRLLTSIPVDNSECAEMIVEWYSWRWLLEEVFKILKKDGFNIEASQLEYPKSIRKLSLMLLEVIIKLFLMRIAYSQPELDIEPNSCYNQQEQECLQQINEKLEGKTAKQKNPFRTHSMAWYSWIIARLGGWKGYEWKRQPGINTYYKGIERFNDTFEGWLIARNVSTR